MSDPSSLMAASTGVSVIGSLTQSKAQSNASNYNATVANQNAQITIDQGNAAALQQGISAQRKIGAMRAAYGASGVSSDAGSPLDVLADSVRSAVLDQQITKYNYGLRALGYKQTAALDSSQAKNASTSGVLNAGSALMSGGARSWAMSQIPDYAIGT
jgi:hypothetical protein